jgi:hypothetical protein
MPRLSAQRTTQSPISACTFGVRGTAHPCDQGDVASIQVKRIIGSELVDANQTLYDEASAYADILGEVQLRTEQILARQRLCTNPQRKLVRSAQAEVISPGPWRVLLDVHPSNQHAHLAPMHHTCHPARW